MCLEWCMCLWADDLLRQGGECTALLYNTELVPLFRYIPPLLWGKSGHLQTALYGKMGRVNTPTPCGVRKFLPMQDGATATFDLFEALGDHSTGGPRQILVKLVKHQRSYTHAQITRSFTLTHDPTSYVCACTQSCVSVR